MPYASTRELPAAVKKLSAKKQRAYMAAFNSVFKARQDEGRAAAAGWAAANSVKESGMAELRAEEVRSLLGASLTARYGAVGEYVWVRDFDSGSVIYERNGKTYRAPYTITDGKATVLDETEVIAKTQYETVEALRSKLDELVTEVGLRGSDNRSSKCMTVCADLIGVGKEEGIGEAVEEVDACLAVLREAPVAKTEDGLKYPAAAFAYVPESDKPSTWKLRLWETPTAKVTRRQLGRAAAALSPGGFRGNRVQIPSDEVAAVKRKIRAAYRALDVADEDIPKWVKESTVRNYVKESITLIQELAAADTVARGILPVRFLVPGFNSDKSRYYTESAIKDATVVFNGAKMYCDHPTDADEKARPERSIRDWVATLKNCHVSDQGNAVGEAHINAGWLKDKAAVLYEQGDLNQLAVSILGIGSGQKEKIDGVETVAVENILKGRSVDFVTEPGAGGRAGLMESPDKSGLDVDLVDEASLRAQRPDLVELIETKIKTEVQSDVSEKTVTELEGQVSTLTEERDDLQGKLTEAETEKAKAVAQATIKEAVGKADLPEPCKARLLEQFTNATDSEGVEDAIKAEAKFVSDLAETGKVKGLGNSKPDPKADRDALEESFVRLGLPKEEAKTAAEGR